LFRACIITRTRTVSKKQVSDLLFEDNSTAGLASALLLKWSAEKDQQPHGRYHASPFTVRSQPSTAVAAAKRDADVNCKKRQANDAAEMATASKASRRDEAEEPPSVAKVPLATGGGTPATPEDVIDLTCDGVSAAARARLKTFDAQTKEVFDLVVTAHEQGGSQATPRWQLMNTALAQRELAGKDQCPSALEAKEAMWLGVASPELRRDVGATLRLRRACDHDIVQTREEAR
jgi:hypothetical protein